MTANTANDAVTFDLGTLTYTGTITGEGTVADTLSLGNGASIAGGTITGVTNLMLANDASVTMTVAQHAQFSGTVTAAGSETVNVTGNGSFTTLANVETYSVGDDSTDARTITLGSGGASVTANSPTDAVTFGVGALTYTGTITGNGMVADTLSLGTGASIAGGTISGVAKLTLAAGASVTMTVAQHDAFTGTVTVAGTEQITFSATGGDHLDHRQRRGRDAYVLGTGGITFALGATGQNVTGSTGNDTVEVGT